MQPLHLEYIPKLVTIVLIGLNQIYLTKCNNLNLDVKLIITNEYEKQITMTPFELLTFIDNAIPT
jgi:hypothetical protein